MSLSLHISIKDAIEDQWQQIADVDGSIMIIVATDAPLDNRNLERLSKRAFIGLGKTGSVVSNGSGDYIIAFSTAPGNRMPHSMPSTRVKDNTFVHNDAMTPLFQAVIEATEEANKFRWVSPSLRVNILQSLIIRRFLVCNVKMT